MKPRETRRNVLIKARMRGPNGWHDACILNLSSRGMMLRAPCAAPRGAYVEIRRGAHIIVARVAWTECQRFGVQAQDPLPVEALVADPDAAVTSPAGRPPGIERRSAARSVDRRHEHSRHRARLFEFAGLAMAGAFAASLAYAAIGEALARPLSAISTAMDSR